MPALPCSAAFRLARPRRLLCRSTTTTTAATTITTSSTTTTTTTSISAPASPAAPADSPAIPRPGKRRLPGSPTLALEAVALPPLLQSSFESALRAASLTPRKMRRVTRPADALLARETAHSRRALVRGRPFVPTAPRYEGHAAVACAAFRAPGSLATNVHVLTEARRCCGGDAAHVRSVLDFGGGVGISVMAAERVFGHAVEEAVVVDHAKDVRALSANILRGPPGVRGGVREEMSVAFAASLREAVVPKGGFDLVCASYSLNEVVRDAIAGAGKGDSEDESGGNGGGEVGDENEEIAKRLELRREGRVKRAEKRLRKVVKELWARTKPGGLFVVVENGTAAGFETVLFARSVVLKEARERSGIGETGGEGEQKEEEEDTDGESAAASGESGGAQKGDECGARVLAPCLHSKTCPLDGSITSHRVCRFQQRFNRPAFLRNALPMHNGFEDEYFSYVVIQKTLPNEDRIDIVDGEAVSNVERPWGRLVRAPLLKGKHAVLDACTAEGKLERRVVSKRKAQQGQYMWARRSKWGDIWPETPLSRPQPVNF